MSLNWKIELSLDSRPRNPMPFLVISLLLHGAVLFGLENYWHQRKANQTLQTKAEELIPIKFIELPPEQVAVTPPVTTKQRASTNSRGSGEAPPKAPSATRALDASSTSLLPSQKPSLTQSKLSTPPRPPQPSKLPQQPPQAPPVTPLSPTAGNQNTSPPVTTAPPAPISASSNQVLRPNPRPVEARPSSQPQSSPSVAPPVPKLSASSSQVLRPNPRPVEARPSSQPQSSPSAAPPVPKLSASSSQVLRPNPRPVEARPSSQPQSSPSAAPPAPISASSSQVLRPNPRPVEARPSSQPQSSPSAAAAPPAPKLSASSSQASRQNASVLGGPVSINNRDSVGENGNNLANAGRIGADSQGVDALKDANLGPYLDGLRQEVIQQWNPERPDSSKQTIVSFAINRTGEVRDLRILQPSGSTILDQAALQAVQRSSPFKPLPRSYSKTLLNIHFKFNINVRGQLELTK